jgi:casein kinase II subunit beta
MDFSQSSNGHSSDSSGITWIQAFLSRRGHEILAVVPEAYILDAFNLTGLSPQVNNFDLALDLLLDSDISHSLRGRRHGLEVEKAATTLYGLIHARFLLSDAGLAQMRSKYIRAAFGTCRSDACNGCPVIPIGVSAHPGVTAVKIFCPRCADVYHPRTKAHALVDGAFFGVTFPHYFFLHYPELRPVDPTRAPSPTAGVPPVPLNRRQRAELERVRMAESDARAPRIFGFRLYDPDTSRDRWRARRELLAGEEESESYTDTWVTDEEPSSETGQAVVLEDSCSEDYPPDCL